MEALLEGINWGAVVPALIAATCLGFIADEARRLVIRRKQVKAAMANVDEEYVRLLESV